MNFNFNIYPVFVGLACGIGSSYFYLNSKSSRNQKCIYLISVILFSIICAKAMFLITLPTYAYSIVQYMSFVNGGGFVFYGGLLGGLFITLIFLKYFKGYQLEGLVPALCLAHCIGRVGCYLTGCCFGLKFGNWVIPIQIIEATCLLLMFIYFHTHKSGIKGDIIKYLFIYAALRFVLEIFRGDIHRGIYFHLSISQWMSITIVLALSFKYKLDSFKIKKS